VLVPFGGLGLVLPTSAAKTGELENRYGAVRANGLKPEA
jgi:hypothetical protein